ncbi:carboxypeptidase M32 [Tuwongella immobilis]|uniref:Metal-dependent carboxypeptidase n=1 Tax=Tuwongella immobilis TaxID=692036 RepID=A0A6C2YQH0_9BACT|nr:carboxypeptidase M32 [Tuwongella immobilis]VIP03255.1 peptidase m32 : Thermostable carboxypeptidase 1 OS=Planctomyces maris DSM 8797 GN=PM8797T_10689 PE=4 SV=1: Peptidase_M32 [Tuwongella immobilis]VTS03852.1 peptidase m32 : Thermostable carboxypeptidase 1 OS=Planctomyces maris DSM 8797 GN=PM8797T_10689 PE=4 SV=1: Peptidase_M32 [Tuwongella immobilis]
MTMRPASYDGLIAQLREASLLGSCAGVLGWDERTNLPPKGSELRGNQMALLARLTHEMVTSPKIGEALADLESWVAQLPPDAEEAANLREIRRSYERAVKLPNAFVEEMARVTTRSQGMWQQARQEKNFQTFQPWLEQILKLKREEAAIVGYSDHPYDALLDEYEPGASTAQITQVFRELSAELVPLIAAIQQSGITLSTDVLEGDYPTDLQQQFGMAAAKQIGFDFDAGRLDVTTHPFCSGIGPGDCRITTRYNPRFFNEAFFGILHEAGHGIYEQNLDATHFGTPLGQATSLGIHESQSRLWENQVGRSRPFWDHFFPKLRQMFPSTVAGVSPDAFYAAINRVQPSFIRVEADEATYNLHIILRFELEQAMLTGDLQASDLPGAWNERFRTMFGLTPPDDKLGCLQDIHWSMGGIGYFPTYTLGNLYAAQFMEAAREQLGDLDGDFRAGEFGRLKQWLTDSIHRHGQRYRAETLCQRISGRPLSHRPLIAYLQAKFTPLYGLR